MHTWPRRRTCWGGLPSSKLHAGLLLYVELLLVVVLLHRWGGCIGLGTHNEIACAYDLMVKVLGILDRRFFGSCV